MLKLGKKFYRIKSEEHSRFVKKQNGNLKFIVHSFTIALLLIRVFSSSAFFRPLSLSLASTLQNAFYSMCFAYQISFTIHVLRNGINQIPKPRENQNRKMAFHSHSLFVFIVSPLFHIYLKLDEVLSVVKAIVVAVVAFAAL